MDTELTDESNERELGGPQQGKKFHLINDLEKLKKKKTRILDKQHKHTSICAPALPHFAHMQYVIVCVICQAPLQNTFEFHLFLVFEYNPVN